MKEDTTDSSPVTRNSSQRRRRSLSSPVTRHSSPDSDVLVRVEHVSKKFCKSLKRSLWYGVRDIAAELNPFSGDSNGLRVTGNGGNVTDNELRVTGRENSIMGAQRGHSSLVTRVSGRSNAEPDHSSPNDSCSSSLVTRHSSPDEELPPLRRDESWAVKDVSFELRRGECLGLIGHNGAGKSTLLKMLNGIIKPDHGRIEMRGRVSALIELGAGFNPVLTGRENIYNKGAILGLTKKEIDEKFDEIVDFAEIGDFLNMPVQNYSSGMRVRLGFAVSAMMDPDVLIIDEVLAVGDVGFRIKCLNKLAKLSDSCAIAFVSHSMPQISRISSQIMLMGGGCVDYYGHNVPKGIDRYLSKFDVGEHECITDGRIVLDAISAYNETKREVNKADGLSVNYGDSVSFAIILGVKDQVEPFDIRLLVYNQEARPVLDTYSKARGLDIYPQNGSVKIEVKFDGVNLNRGLYSVALTVLARSNNEVLLRANNLLKLHMTSHYYSWADVLVDANWKQVG